MLLVNSLSQMLHFLIGFFDVGTTTAAATVVVIAAVFATGDVNNDEDDDADDDVEIESPTELVSDKCLRQEGVSLCVATFFL